jgi:hypothetical protein
MDSIALPLFVTCSQTMMRSYDPIVYDEHKKAYGMWARLPDGRNVHLLFDPVVRQFGIRLAGTKYYVYFGEFDELYTTTMGVLGRQARFLQSLDEPLAQATPYPSIHHRYLVPTDPLNLVSFTVDEAGQHASVLMVADGTTSPTYNLDRLDDLHRFWSMRRNGELMFIAPRFLWDVIKEGVHYTVWLDLDETLNAIFVHEPNFARVAPLSKRLRQALQQEAQRAKATAAPLVSQVPYDLIAGL